MKSRAFRDGKNFKERQCLVCIGHKHPIVTMLPVTRTSQQDLYTRTSSGSRKLTACGYMYMVSADLGRYFHEKKTSHVLLD